MVDVSKIRALSKFDVIKFARSVLSEVENTRSYDLIFDNESKQGSHLPTESRVNAFFRLIGLPMFISEMPKNPKSGTSGEKTDEKILTPGLHEGEQEKGVIIQNSINSMFKNPDGRENNELSVSTLLSLREGMLIGRESRMGTEAFNDAMISSFYEPIDPILNANVWRSSNYAFIYPALNELARPFVPDPNDYKVDDQALKGPFIETVIRIRAVSARGGNQTQQNYLQQMRDSLQSLSESAFASDNEALRNSVPELVPEEATLLEASIISNMMSSIEQLAKKWVALIRKKERLASDVRVTLVPKTGSAKQSPFGKRSNISLSLQIEPKTDLGRRRAKLKQRIAVADAMFALLPTEDATDKKTSAQFSAPRNISSNALTGTFLSILRQDLDQERSKLAAVENRIKEESQKADALRTEMEMMTGEFTGLSILDVVFTILGLFLVDIEELVAMLDKKTQDLMRLDTTLESVVDSAGDTTTKEAVESLEEKVKTLYQLFYAYVDTAYDRLKRISINRDPTVSQQVDRIISNSDNAQRTTTDED
jgi:hypothetical protein